MSTEPTKRIVDMDDDELPGGIKALQVSLERYQSVRRTRWLASIQRYEGRQLAGLHATTYYRDTDHNTDQYDSTRVNIISQAVDTVVAEVAGKQRPKMQCVVNSNEWRTKRKAKKMEQAVEATMLQPQEAARDAWEVGVSAYVDCCLGDIGFVKVWPDFVECKVRVERLQPWQVYIDPREAQNGWPMSIMHVYPYDKWALAEQYPKKRKDILNAPDISANREQAVAYGSETTLSNQTLVYEFWRRSYGKKAPGMHAIVIEGVCLLREEWLRRDFPIEPVVYRPHRVGCFGTSIAELLIGLHDEANAGMQRWSDAETKGSNAVCIVEKDSVDMQAMQSNEQAIVVEVEKGTTVVPQWIQAATISSSSLEWNNLVRTVGLQLFGISEQSATGTAPAQLSSGTAQRTHANIATQRLNVQWQTFERLMAIGIPRQIIAATRELAEDDPAYVVKLFGATGDAELKWSDFALDDDMVAIQPAAVSGLVNTPEDRKSMAQDLLQLGIMSKDAYARAVQANAVDPEIEKASIQERLIAKWMGEWLDADLEEPGALAEFQSTKFQPPEGDAMNLDDAMVQVARGFLSALYEGCPPENLLLFKNWMKLCKMGIDKRDAFVAEQQAAARGKAAGGVMGDPTGGGAPVGPPPGPPPGAMAPPPGMMQ